MAKLCDIWSPPQPCGRGSRLRTATRELSIFVSWITAGWRGSSAKALL